MMQANNALFKGLAGLCSALCLAFSAGVASAHPLHQPVSPLTVAALENATYHLSPMPDPVQLTNGQYADQAAQIYVELTDFWASGDLNGDGIDDAAVILRTNTGGTDNLINLFAVLNMDGEARPIAAALLSNQVKVESLAITNRQITVGLLIQGPEDAQCCPSTVSSATYTLVGDQLVRKPAKAFGRLLAFPQGDLYGYVNVLGEFAIDPQFVVATEFSEGLASVSLDGQTTGFINRLGEMVIQPQFAYAGSFVQGLATVGLPNPDTQQPFVVAYIDRQGNLLFNGARFAAAEPFSEGLAAVSIDGKSYGYINRAGQFVIEPHFTYAEPFAEGLAAVQIGEQFGYIDTTGQLIIEAHYQFAKPFSEGLAMINLADKTGYIDHQGKIVIEPQFDYGHSFQAGRALVAKAGKEQYIDRTGQVIGENLSFTNGQDFSQGLAAVKLGDLFGYINLDGDLAIQPEFSYVGAFNNDMALAQTPDVQGIIDPTGAWLLAIPRFSLNDELVNLSNATATQVIDYTPAIPAETRQGRCVANSSAIAGDHAWRCQVDDQTYDPCLTAADSQTLVCAANPARNEAGFKLELTKSLPEAKPAATAASAIWLFQTGDTASCEVAVDVRVSIDNKPITHVCSDGAAILGDINQTGELWQAEKVQLINDAQGHFTVGSAEQVAVVIAWRAAQP